MLRNYICNIPYSKTENCIIINARDWVDKSDSVLITNKKNTGVQVVDGVGYTEVFTTHNTNTGDEVLITKVASQIAYLRPYEIPDDVNKYANIHQMQIIGKFMDDKLELFYDKVELEKIEFDRDTAFITDDSSFCAYKVINIGSHSFTDDWKPKPLEVQVDMIVLVDEHVCTVFDDRYFVEESKIVGYFNGDITIENLVPFSTKILLEPVERLEKNGSLYNPLVNLDEEDISEVYNRDRFNVIHIGSYIDTVKEGDTISIGRDYLNNIIFSGKEYFIASSDEYIRGILC